MLHRTAQAKRPQRARARGKQQCGPLILDPTVHIEPGQRGCAHARENGATVVGRRSGDERLTTELHSALENASPLDQEPTAKI